jgi:molecular chaperone DnaK (HSP70)
MPLKIELRSHYQLRTKDNDPQVLLLPAIELIPIVSSNLPHIYRITISVSGTDSELTEQIESAYKSYNAGRLVKLENPLRTKQSDCRLNKPIPENFNCTLKVSVEYYDSNLEGSADESKLKNSSAECYIFSSSVSQSSPAEESRELSAEKPAAIPLSPAEESHELPPEKPAAIPPSPVMETHELSAEKPAATPSRPVMETRELPTEKPKNTYLGFFAIDFGTSNSTVTLYDPKLIVTPNSLPKEQEQYLREKLAEWVKQRATNSFSNRENEEWEKLLKEFGKNFQGLNLDDRANLGAQIFLGTNSTRLLEAIRLLEICLSQRREEFRRAVSNELNEIYYQVSRVPSLEWQSLIAVELNKNNKLSEIPSELEIVSFDPSLPEEDPFKVKVLMGERARQNRKQALDEGQEIEGKFHHSPKRYLGQQEHSIPVTLNGNTANIKVKKLIQAAWAHLIELTDDYRREHPDKCGQGNFSKGVVTYPTIAPPVVRLEIEQLVKELGIDDVQIAYDEAVSAAIFYLWREFGGDLNTGIESFKTRCRSEGDTWSQNVLILDIGGGTTDLALIRLTLKEIDPFEPNEDRGDGGRYYVLTPKLLGSSGHLQLGGELITLRLFLLLKAAIADCLLTAVTEERLQQDELKIQINELSEHFIVDGKFKKGTLLACLDKQEPESDAHYKDALSAAEKVLPTRWKESRQSRRVQAFYTLWEHAERAKIHLGQKDQTTDFILNGQEIADMLLQNDIQLPNDNLDSLSVKLTVQQFENVVIPVLQEAIGIANGLMMNSFKKNKQQVDWLILSGKTCNLDQVKGELYRAFSNSEYFVWNPERITFVPKYAKLATSIGACYAEKLRQLTFDPVYAKPMLVKGANQLYFDVKNLFYFLPCSFLREVIGDPPMIIIFEAGQELYQLDSDSVAKVRSNWQGAQLTNNIRRQDFEGKTAQLWGGFNGEALAKTLNMGEREFRESIKIQFEVNQKLEFTLRFCNGNPHYMIPPANEHNSIDATPKIQAPVISQGKVVRDIAVNVAESAAALKTDAENVIFEAAKDYSKELKIFCNEEDETVKRQGLISAPLPPFPLSGKHMFYFQVYCPDSNTWELIGELPKPKNKTEYPCEYRVTLDEKGILQIHAGEVPYREGDNKENLNQEGYVFRTAVELESSGVVDERNPFSGIH